jgi:hypothetical protein
MWKTLLTFALIGAMQSMTAGQSARLEFPPMILNLGFNISDGSVTVACNGIKPTILRVTSSQSPIGEEFRFGDGAGASRCCTKGQMQIAEKRPSP